jgi:hypothetical protein
VLQIFVGFCELLKPQLITEYKFLKVKQQCSKANGKASGEKGAVVIKFEFLT